MVVANEKNNKHARVLNSRGIKKLFLVSIVRGREEDVKNDTSML
jgi:hypothetical protein